MFGEGPSRCCLEDGILQGLLAKQLGHAGRDEHHGSRSSNMRFLPVMGDGDVVACSDIGFDVSHFNIIVRKFKVGASRNRHDVDEIDRVYLIKA